MILDASVPQVVSWSFLGDRMKDDFLPFFPALFLYFTFFFFK